MNGILSSRRLALLLLTASLILYGFDYLIFGSGEGITAGLLGTWRSSPCMCCSSP